MSDISLYIQNYLSGAQQIISLLDQTVYSQLIEHLVTLKHNQGRLFIIGVGGSAANCSHAVNDFRKICHIETYTPTDNIAEITARTNDDGFDTIFSEWLKTSRLTNNDLVFVFSVGGGNLEKNVSPNIVRALQYTKTVGAKILGIVSRDGGYTKQVADACLLVPIISDSAITPYAESFQALIWHGIVNFPELSK